MKKLFLVAAFIAAAFVGIAQTKEELQKKQEDLKKEIAELTDNLSQIQKNKKTSLRQLAAAQRKIAAREELINNISRELRIIEDDMFLNEREIYRLGKELDTLKAKYAQSIVFAYKNRSSYQYLNFLFSSTSFNDAIKRIAYLRSYRQLRETQVDNIVKTQQLLEQRKVALTSNRADKGKVLNVQSAQLKDLEDDKKQKDEVVKDLKNQEKDISAQIRKKEKQRKDMQVAIAAIIKREIEAARKREREAALAAAKKKEADDAAAKKKAAENNTPAKSNPTASNTKPRLNEPATGMASTGKGDRDYSPLESTPEGKEMSINFEKSRGSLPWPVSTGSIAIPFGPYQIGKLTGNSEGIEIGLPEGSTVKCVADGKVSAVYDIGGEQTITIRHGKYFTTYSHMASVSVSKDQEVKGGTVLGKSGTDVNGDGALLFMINNEKGTPLNPKSWLKPSIH